jgi:hypothetical protein
MVSMRCAQIGKQSIPSNPDTLETMRIPEMLRKRSKS